MPDLVEVAREAVDAAMEKNFAVITVAIKAQIAEFMVMRFRQEIRREVEQILRQRGIS